MGGGFEVVVLPSLELPAKRLNVFFVQTQIMQSVGGSLD